MKRSYWYIFLGVLVLLTVLSSCMLFDKKNQGLVNVSGNAVIAGVKAKVFDIKVEGVISKSDIIYNSQKYLLLSKVNKGFTEILVAKPGIVDIQKGEVLFSIRKNFKILEVFPINKLPERKVEVNRVTEAQDGLSFMDFCVLEGQQATLVIHAKNLPQPENGQLKAIKLKISYPPEYMDLDTSRHGDGDPNGFARLMTNKNDFVLDEPEYTDGNIYISISSQGTFSIDDDDMIAVYFVAENVNPKAEIVISGTVVEYIAEVPRDEEGEVGLEDVSPKPDVHFADVTIYDPDLLGDLNDDKETTIEDFVEFMNHYNTESGDADYDEEADIYPAEKVPSSCSPEWAGIWSLKFPDGKIDVYDFVVFAANYGKSEPVKNFDPSSPQIGDGSDDDDGPTDNDGKVEKDTESGLPITDVYLEFRSSDPDGDVLYATIYFGKTESNMTVVASQIEDNGSNDADSDDNQWAVKITDYYGDLEYGQTYYWKVVVEDGKGGEAESDTWSFSTQNLQYMLFAAGVEGIVLMDVSNLTSISVQAEYDTPGYAHTAVKTGTNAGDHIFVADGSEGVTILDINAGPAFALNSNNINAGGEVRTLDYYTDGTNDYVFVGVDDYVKVYDVTDLSNIEYKSKVYVSGQPLSMDIKTSDDKVYLFVGTDVGKLYIIDVTSVYNPSIVSSMDVNGNIEYVVYDATSKYLYVAKGNSGIGIVDITDVSNPTEVGSYDTDGRAEAIDVKARDNRLYVADGVGGILIFDISDKTNPSLLGSVVTEGYAQGIKVVGKYAYVADRLQGMQVYDISDYQDIKKEASYNPGTYARSVSNVVQMGGTYYIAVADGSGGVHIYEAAGALDSSKLKYTLNIENGYARDVYILDQVAGGGNHYYYIVVAEGSGGISVYSTNYDGDGNYFESADDDVQRLAHYNTDGYAYSIVVRPDDNAATGRIYVMDGTNGVVTIPYNGASAGNSFNLLTDQIDQDDVNGGIAMHGILADDGTNYRLIVADGPKGVASFNVTADPDDPAKEAEKTLSGTAYQVYYDSSNYNLWIACGDTGIVAISSVYDSGASNWDNDWSDNTVNYGPPKNNKTFVAISDDGPANTIYFALGSDGVLRFNISDTNIESSDLLEIYDTEGKANDLVYENDGGDRLFVADGENGLMKFDDPTNLSGSTVYDVDWFNFVDTINW